MSLSESHKGDTVMVGNTGRQKGHQAKVLMLGPDLSNKGGVAAVVNIYLAAWDPGKYDVKHIATFVNGPKFVKLLVALRAIVQFFYWVCRWKPNILHMHFSSNASFYRKSLFVVLAKIIRLKTILHCHAPDFDVFYGRRSALGQRYIHAILNYADRLLVVAEQWRRYFEHLALDVPVLTLYNPVVYPSDTSHPTDHRPVVLSLGRLGQRKGTYDTLQAIPQVLETCPEAEFWFGGDGDVEQVRSILSATSWGKQVRLLGWVRGKEKEETLAQASVFLLPSYHEGLPVALLEAMACGLPVISTPVGGIPELVIDGETGFLIPPGDTRAMARKVTALLSDAELRGRIGTNARRCIKDKFEAKAIIEQLFSVYDTLMSESEKTAITAGEGA
jgi:glycosyltransferase involved in cell wall biosynthesis